MERTQCYIGTPSGVILCVDQSGENQFTGRMYNAYSKETVTVNGIGHMLFELEQFLNSINFPHVSTNERSFREKVHAAAYKGKREKVMSDEELLKRHGEIGTFIIRVQHRQNSSWQGRITWIDKDETLYFRSVWELIKLIAGAIERTDGQSEEEDVSWSNMHQVKK